MACSCAGKILFPKYSCATRKCVSGLLIINAESQEKKKKDYCLDCVSAKKP